MTLRDLGFHFDLHEYCSTCNGEECHAVIHSEKAGKIYMIHVLANPGCGTKNIMNP